MATLANTQAMHRNKAHGLRLFLDSIGVGLHKFSHYRQV